MLLKAIDSETAKVDFPELAGPPIVTLKGAIVCLPVCTV